MPSSAEFGAVGEFAASLHGAFTRRQAAQLGASHHVVARWIRGGILREPAPGVLVFTGAPETWRQRVRVATLAGSGRSIAIAESAGRLHHIDGLERTDDICVSVPRGARNHLPGVVTVQNLHTYTVADVVEIDGIRATGLARTICDLAARGKQVLERCVDDFERRGASLNWLEHTARRLQTNGRPAIADVLAEVSKRRTAGRVRDSWFEKLVQECLRSQRIPGLVTQLEISDDEGNFIGRVDLAVPLVRLAIECHSRRWHTGPRRELIDQRRDNRLGEIGWDVRYLGWEDQHRTPRQTCAFIERLVLRRASDLHIPLPWAS